MIRRPKSQALQSARGFTLVEVMVAMAVVAVAMPALLFALFQQLDGAEYLRERTLASWVAANKLSEVQLVLASSGELPRGELIGESTLAGRDWRWRVNQEPTQLPGFTRVTVTVERTDDSANTANGARHSLSAFVIVGEDR